MTETNVPLILKSKREMPNRLNDGKEVACTRCRDIREVSTSRVFILARFNELMFDHDVASRMEG